MKWVFTLSVSLILLTACSAPLAPTGAPQADMPNPASAYCVEQGYQSEIRTAADGSQSGVCIFPDGSECDEWAYFRNECRPVQEATVTEPVPTQQPTVSERDVLPHTNLLPAGAIIDPRNGSMDFTRGLIFYNTDGLILGELLAPRGGQVHVAGHYQGYLNLPLVFHTHELESEKGSLNLNSGSTPTDPGGRVSLLVPLEEKAMLSGLVGVPGEPTLFYITFQPIDLETLQSKFFVGSIDEIATLEPVLTLDSQESCYWKPVAIGMKDGQPDGLWLTRNPWGIGGEIIYTPNEGLRYLDLATGTVTEILPAEYRFDSLSSDQTWVAYSQRTEADSQFMIRDLAGGEPIAIPSVPENNRGAGDGMFSPSSKYVAWREAQGSLFDGSFQQTIRIATLDGQIIADFKDIPFYKTAEFSDGTEVKPVGWLDDENLLVQVVAPEKPGGRGAVVKLNVTTGQFTLFAQGFFAGWFYR